MSPGFSGVPVSPGFSGVPVSLEFILASLSTFTYISSFAYTSNSAPSTLTSSYTGAIIPSAFSSLPTKASPVFVISNFPGFKIPGPGGVGSSGGVGSGGIGSGGVGSPSATQSKYRGVSYNAFFPFSLLHSSPLCVPPVIIYSAVSSFETNSFGSVLSRLSSFSLM